MAVVFEADRQHELDRGEQIRVGRLRVVFSREPGQKLTARPVDFLTLSAPDEFDGDTGLHELSVPRR